MRDYRLNRLFHPTSGRLLDVAVDHGLPGEGSLLTGIENMPDVIGTLVDAAPDALLLSVGQAPLLQALPGRNKPSLVLRVDTTNIYANELSDEVYDVAIDDPVGEAVRLDAACVVLNLLDVPGRPAARRDCVQNVMSVKAGCAPVGMPLMVEPLAFAPDSREGYDTVRDADRLVPLVRQAVELGADVIKVDAPDDLAEFHRVVEIAAPVPVLVRGGGRVSDDELLTRTRAVLDQGARGIVYGRNIIQHEAPAAITKALMAMLHDDLTVEQAHRVLAER